MNKDCEYYPCHQLATMNCLFCYCPLYHIQDCGGSPKVLDNGTKDCSACKVPHSPIGYDFVIKNLRGLKMKDKSALVRRVTPGLFRSEKLT